jgi:hypothetical protein
MAITITVDNNRNNNTPNFTVDPLLLDETAGVQPSGSPVDDGNDINVILTDPTPGNLASNFDGTLSGLLAPFATLLNATTIMGFAGLRLSDTQKAYAAGVDGASSSSDFIKVETTASETINDLFFSDSAGAALDGDQVFISPGVPLQTLSGDNIYLYSSGDFAIATTSPVAGAGRVVAAFYLNDSAVDHKTASVQMVTFEPMKHPNSTDPDDQVNFTDILRVSASGSLSFDFDQLKSGECLWAAVGSATAGVLISGENIYVDADGKKTNVSDKLAVSQGGAGTTIGVNNQLFDNVGETAVFTLVTGLDVLNTADAGAQSDYLLDHTGPKADGVDYGGFMNVTGAGIFISQSQGNDVKNIDINVTRAGGINGTNVEEGLAYVGTQPSGAFDDDIKVAVGTVTVRDDTGAIVATWVVGADPDGAGPLRANGASVASTSTKGIATNIVVTIGGGLGDADPNNDNNIDVNGLLGGYTVSWTSLNGATFNRFQLTSEGGQFDVGRIDITQTIPGGSAVGDKLIVEDDGPGLTGANVSKQVDEDELSSSSVAPADTSDGITDGDSNTDEVSYTNADLQAIVTSGTDSPATFALNLSVSGAVKDIDGNAMTSKGQAITWSVAGGVISAVAGGRVVFTLTQTAGTGTPNDPTDDVFTVDLRDQLDHPNASGDNGIETLDLTPAFTARDADGDPVDLNGSNNLGTPIRLVVENDIPALSGQSVSKQVDEDELSTSSAPPADTSNGITDGDANTDEVTYSNADLQAVVTAGADEPIIFALNLLASGAVVDIDGNAMTSKGQAMTWSVSGGVVSAVAGGRTVLTITQTAGGATLNDPSDDVFTVDLRDQLDHPNASGDNGIETLDLTAVFTARDFDGDAIDLNGADNLQRPIRLIVENDIPALSGANVSKQVDEDELSTSSAPPADTSNGITDGDANTDEVSYSNADLQAVVTSGADEPINFALNLLVSGAVKDIDGNSMTSKGDAITWSVAGGVISGVAGGRTVFTLTQTAGTGTPNDPTDDVFTVDLRDQLDHPNASGDNGIETLDLTPAFTAKDFDGDPVDLNGANDLATPIRLIVENDVGALSGQNASIRVEEDELSTAAPPPADTSNGITDGDADTDEATLTYAALNAIVTPGADEPTAYALNLSVSGAVKDIDGNSMTSGGQAITWSVNGSTIEAVAGGRVVFTVTQSAGTGTPNDPTDDAWTIDLRDQLDHPNASGDNGIETIDLTPAFTAKDFDGDPVDLNGANDLATPIRLIVENDVPALSGANVSKQVDEDELSTSSAAPADTSDGITDGDANTDEVTYSYADLAAVVTIGADDPVSFALNLSVSGAVKDIDGNAMTSKGDAMTWSVSGGVISAIANGRVVFTLTQTAGTGTPNDPTDDAWTVDLRDQLDHPNASGDNGIETIDLTPAFTAKDYDGDPVDLNGSDNLQTPIRLVVENDVPAFSGQIVSQTLDWVDENSVTGSLKGLPGADEPASYKIDKYTDLAGYDEALSPDGKTLTYSQGGVVKFTLALSDSANGGAGGYTFTVNEPPPLETRQLDFQDLASGQNLFGTVAFDKTNISNNGTPGDTTDDFLPDGGLMTFPSNLDINDLDLNDPIPSSPAESNDGTMTADSGTTNTSKGGGPVTIGNTNQAFDSPDEGAWFVYVDDPKTKAVSGVGLDATGADDADNVEFNGTVPVGQASVEIVQASGKGTTKLPGPEMLIQAWDLNPGNVVSDAQSRAFVLDPTNGGTQVNIIGIKIYDATGALIEYRTNLDAGATNGGQLMDSGDAGTNVTAADDSAVNISFVLTNPGAPGNSDDVYSAVVGNLKANYTIEWITEGTHDAALVQNRSGSYDIGGFNLLQGQDTPDVDFEFSVSVTDRDGDVYRGFDTTWDDFKIKVDGTGVNNDPNNVAPTAFSTSYDTVSGFAPLSTKTFGYVNDTGMNSSLALNKSGFVDDSGMAPELRAFEEAAITVRGDLIFYA